MKTVTAFIRKYRMQILSTLLIGALYGLLPAFFGFSQAQGSSQDLSVNLGWTIPSLGGLLTFMIRLFFVVAGLAALFFLLLGALAWVTSGGSKDKVEAAQQKIVNAIIGVVLIVVVLSVIVTLEQLVFKCRICFGVSCPVTLPSLMDPSANDNEGC